jgi:hypothetical protein
VSAWLDPVRAALDAVERPVAFFFRDDDVGWADDRLEALLDRFATTATPVDLAVIPAELTGPLVDRLAARRADSGGRLGLHQHGWAHVDHEAQGRKHEFGPSRAAAGQRADLARGRAALAEAFGVDSGEFFVPPWNRCTEVTARLLVQLGFRVLSRDGTAPPLAVDGLAELPVTVDWFARRRGGGRIDPAGRGDLLGSAITTTHPVGVMLHHEVMSEDDLDQVGSLTELLAGHPNAQVRTMAELAATGTA